MCVQIHLPDGRVIEAVTSDWKPIYEGEQPTDGGERSCLCGLSIKDVFRLIIASIEIPQEADQYSLQIERVNTTEYHVDTEYHVELFAGIKV